MLVVFLLPAQTGFAFTASRHDQMTSTDTPSAGHTSSEPWHYADTSGVCDTTHLTAANPRILTQVATPRCVW